MLYKHEAFFLYESGEVYLDHLSSKMLSYKLYKHEVFNLDEIGDGSLDMRLFPSMCQENFL